MAKVLGMSWEKCEFYHDQISIFDLVWKLNCIYDTIFCRTFSENCELNKSHLNLFKTFKLLAACFKNWSRQIDPCFISTSYRTVPSAIRQIFNEFLIFCDLFHKPIREWNNGKIWETSKVFVNIARVYCEITIIRNKI